LAIVIDGRCHRPRSLHHLLVNGCELAWKDRFLGRGSPQHPANLVGVVAREPVFGQPGELEEKYVPAFAQLLERAQFAPHRCRVGRVHGDEAFGHVWVTQGEYPGEYATPIMSYDGRTFVSQALDQAFDVTRQCAYIVAPVWLVGVVVPS